jgi:uncharacterized protein YggU (UPF0235/DUF167 family)
MVNFRSNANFCIEGESVSFWLKVKPRARRERLVPATAGELQLELLAPAIEGRANEACVLFLARELRLPQACVVILAGAKSRRKLVRITGRSAMETIEQLSRLVSGGKGRRRVEAVRSGGLARRGQGNEPAGGRGEF